jgi:hypothetical protein
MSAKTDASIVHSYDWLTLGMLRFCGTLTSASEGQSPKYNTEEAKVHLCLCGGQAKDNVVQGGGITESFLSSVADCGERGSFRCGLFTLEERSTGTYQKGG